VKGVKEILFFHRILGHRKDIWSFDVNSSETRLISISGDGILRVFKLLDKKDDDKMETDEDDIKYYNQKRVVYWDSLSRINPQDGYFYYFLL